MQNAKSEYYANEQLAKQVQPKKEIPNWMKPSTCNKRNKK